MAAGSRPLESGSEKHLQGFRGESKFEGSKEDLNPLPSTYELRDPLENPRQTQRTIAIAITIAAAIALPQHHRDDDDDDDHSHNGNDDSDHHVFNPTGSSRHEPFTPLLKP